MSENNIQNAFEEAATHLEMSADHADHDEKEAWVYVAKLLRRAARKRLTRMAQQIQKEKKPTCSK